MTHQTIADQFLDQWEKATPTEITRLIKGALRKAFPDSTFRVSSNNNIRIDWTDDGPTVEQVQRALVNAKCAELDEPTWNGHPRFKGPGGTSYAWFTRYNEAKRTAEAAEWKRRRQEHEAQQQREQAAIEAASQAKRVITCSEAKPIATSSPPSDPAAFEVFEELRQRAEVDVATSSKVELQRRPSWAPPLIIEGELLEVCRELGYLGADDKPIVRLWAQFADPKRKGTSLREQRSDHPLAGIVCRGFQLHAGSERGPSGSILFEAQRTQSGQWRFGPTVHVSTDSPRSPHYHKWKSLIRERANARDQDHIERLTREIAEIDAKDLENARAYQRQGWLRQRAVELARARLLEFAGAPGVQMQAASRLWGRCFNCGKELTDPISLERGIGPDCLVGKVDHIRYLATHLGRERPGLVPPAIVTVERIVFWSAMPLEFVQATIDEMPVDASGRRVQPAQKKPKPIDGSNASAAPEPNLFLNKPITGLKDVRLVPTPVTYSRWSDNGWKDRVEDRLQAILFADMAQHDFTVITSNAYGEPFLQIGRLQAAVIKPGSGRSPWQLRISLVPPKQRNALSFERDFPSDAIVLMRGRHDIALDGLPTLTAPLRWHCTNFTSTWREVARRCYAIAGPQVLIDTIEAAVSAQQERHAVEKT